MRARLGRRSIRLTVMLAAVAGARHFVRHPPLDVKRIISVVNLDMIGRGDEDTLVVAGTYYYPQLKQVVAESAHGRRITIVFGHDRRFGAAREC
jgi:hypothetical protein